MNAGSGSCVSRYWKTSSFVIFPPIPVPSTSERSTLLSAAIRSARGETCVTSLPGGLPGSAGISFSGSIPPPSNFPFSSISVSTPLPSPRAVSTSFSVIAPSGPVPRMVSRERFRSSARILARGETGIFPAPLTVGEGIDSGGITLMGSASFFS